MGKLYYLMGKSASGKDTLYEKLLEDQSLHLNPLVLWTTRPMRSGETDGVDYHFTDAETALRMQEEGKVIELRTYMTVHGPWMYFTADDGRIDLTHKDYIGVGTLESYEKLKAYFDGKYVEDQAGHCPDPCRRETLVVPLYVEVEDGLRLSRALERERKQGNPKYEELCRRFLADQKDFSPEKLKQAGITLRIDNSGSPEESLKKIKDMIIAESK